MPTLMLQAAETLGYRIGCRLRHERTWFRALRGVVFIAGRGYRCTDVREDSIYSTVIINRRTRRPYSRKALRRIGIES